MVMWFPHLTMRKWVENKAISGASQVALVVKKQKKKKQKKKTPANSGDLRDVGSIPGSGRPLEQNKATHSSILAWRTLWTEESGDL